MSNQKSVHDETTPIEPASACQLESPMSSQHFHDVLGEFSIESTESPHGGCYVQILEAVNEDVWKNPDVHVKVN